MNLSNEWRQCHLGTCRYIYVFRYLMWLLTKSNMIHLTYQYMKNIVRFMEDENETIQGWKENKNSSFSSRERNSFEIDKIFFFNENIINDDLWIFIPLTHHQQLSNQINFFHGFPPPIPRRDLWVNEYNECSKVNHDPNCCSQA